MGNAACCSSTSQTMDFGDMSPSRMKQFNVSMNKNKHKPGIFPIIRPESLSGKQDKGKVDKNKLETP